MIIRDLIMPNETVLHKLFWNELNHEDSTVDFIVVTDKRIVHYNSHHYSMYTIINSKISGLIVSYPNEPRKAISLRIYAPNMEISVSNHLGYTGDSGTVPLDKWNIEFWRLYNVIVNQVIL